MTTTAAQWCLVGNTTGPNLAVAAVPEALADWRVRYLEKHYACTAEVILRSPRTVFVGRGMAKLTEPLVLLLPDGRELQSLESDLSQLRQFLTSFDSAPQYETPAGTYIRFGGHGPLVYVNREETEALLRQIDVVWNPGRAKAVREELIATLARVNGVSVEVQKGYNDIAAAAEVLEGTRRTQSATTRRAQRH